MSKGLCMICEKPVPPNPNGTFPAACEGACLEQLWADSEPVEESQPVEQKTEEIARRIARERGMPESMWELFLMDAYDELFFTP